MISTGSINRNIFFIVLLIPLISIPFYEVTGLSFSNIIGSIIIAYGIFFFIAKKNIQIPRLAVFILIFSIYVFIWSFFNGDFDKLGLIKTIGYNDYLVTFFILLLIYNTQLSAKFFSKSVTLIKFLITITAIGSVIQMFNQDFFQYEYVNPQIEESIYQIRRTSIYTFEKSNALGLSFIPLLSVLIGYMLYAKDKTYIYFLFIGGLVALLSNTRYIMIGFIILSAQIIYYKKIKVGSFFKYAIILLVFGFLAIETLEFLGYNIYIWFNERLFHEGAITETTRYKAIGNFAIFFPEKPIIGTGGLTQAIQDVSAADSSSHIHVGYLSHLVYYGIVGCFFLFGFWWLLIRRLYKNAKITKYWGSFFAMLTFLFAFATMSESSFFFSGLIFVVIFDKYFTENVYIIRQFKKRSSSLK